MSTLSTAPFSLFESYETHPRTKMPRKRNLKFDVNALADFEQTTGMGFGQLMQQRAAYAVTRALVWAGLKHEDRTLTIEKVGTLLGQYIRDGGAIDEVLTIVFKAAADQGVFGDMPDLTDVEEANMSQGEDQTSPATGESGSLSLSPSPSDD